MQSYRSNTFSTQKQHQHFHLFHLKYILMKKLRILVVIMLIVAALTFYLIPSKTLQVNDADTENKAKLAWDRIRHRDKNVQSFIDHTKLEKNTSKPKWTHSYDSNVRKYIQKPPIEISNNRNKAHPLWTPVLVKPKYVPPKLLHRFNAVPHAPQYGPHGQQHQNTLQRPPIHFLNGTFQQTRMKNFNKKFIKQKSTNLRGKIRNKQKVIHVPQKFKVPAVNINLNQISKIYKSDITILKRDLNTWNHADYICQILPTNMATIDVPTPLGNVQIHGTNTESFETESASEHYEMGLLAGFQKIVLENPRSIVIDVGSGYGVFTIITARMGHQTIAVEPNLSAIAGLCVTIRLANFSHKVIITHMTSNPTQLEVQNPTTDGHDTPVCVNYLDLDALAEITSLQVHEDVIIRISPRINYAEELLLCARKIFRRFNVKAVSMPWIKTTRRDAKNILKLFSSMKMSPYEPDSYQNLLNSSEMSQWPNIVVWKHVQK